MPELPEVEAVTRALREDGLPNAFLQEARMERPLVTRPQDPLEVEALTSRVTVLAVRRRAKNILIDLSNEHTLRIHLRMTGDVSIKTEPYDAPRTLRAQWTIHPDRCLVFVDPRALGRIHVHKTSEVSKVLGKLGPEPLSEEFTKERFLAIARSSRLPAKLFLMDQNKIAGLGNIYAAEVLFRAGISPQKAIASLSTARLIRLWSVIRETLQIAVHSIYNAYRSPGGYRQHRDDFHRMVYGRKGEGCIRCGRPIRKEEQGGRSTYFCAHCQR